MKKHDPIAPIGSKRAKRIQNRIKQRPSYHRGDDTRRGA